MSFVIEISKFMRDMVDVKEEGQQISKELTNIATNADVCILGFIASYRPAKISPTKTVSPEVGLSEEFGIEQAISDIKDKWPDVEKCFVLLNSPGGLVDSSYKIAYLLRKSFKDITIFVPHVALSGGTLIALAGNRIVMGPMSQLSPLDVQLVTEEYQFSMKSILTAFQRAVSYFTKVDVDDTPYPWQLFAEKLNPILIEECSSELDTMWRYTKKILSMGMFSTDTKKAEEIAKKLVYDFPTHNYVINIDEARDVGLVVNSYTDYSKIWGVLREWLSIYAPMSTDKHFIRYVIPSKN